MYFSLFTFLNWFLTDLSVNQFQPHSHIHHKLVHSCTTDVKTAFNRKDVEDGVSVYTHATDSGKDSECMSNLVILFPQVTKK